MSLFILDMVNLTFPNFLQINNAVVPEGNMRESNF